MKTTNLYQLLNGFTGDDYEKLKDILLNHLTKQDQTELREIADGKKLPSLSSDIIAKKIFSPEEHPDRLEWLLQKIIGDSAIQIGGGVPQEGYTRSELSKKIVMDIPANLVDGRYVDTEMQQAPQSFFLKRGDIYAADMLMIQYSKEEGKAKGDIDYKNVKSAVLIMLLKNSPDFFRESQTDRYIHRFDRYMSDSGLSYKPLSNNIYIQLDKCLKQFLNQENGEDNDELQLFLCMMADINHPLVLNKAKNNKMTKEIVAELGELAQDKEVQKMMLAEKYAVADYNAALSYAREDGSMKMLYDLVESGDLPIEKAANKAGVTVEQFRNNMLLTGYTV